MKKLLLLSLVVFQSGLLFAGERDFGPFKVGIGVGYASPSDKNLNGGAIGYIEPAYRITDRILVGLRAEGAGFAGVKVSNGSSSTTADVGATAISSYGLLGQYYLSNGGFRPFIGVGVSQYTIAALNESAGSAGVASVTSAAEKKIGYYPRVGFDAGHFNLIVDYNLIPDTKIDVSSTSGSKTSVTMKHSYVGFKLGFAIGGGKKR